MQVGLRHFDEIAEGAAESDLQVLDARARALGVFHFGDHLLAGSADVPQLVDFLVETVAHESAVARQRRRLVGDRLVDPLPQVRQVVELAGEAAAAAAPGNRSAAARASAPRPAIARAQSGRAGPPSTGRCGRSIAPDPGSTSASRAPCRAPSSSPPALRRHRDDRGSARAP